MKMYTTGTIYKAEDSTDQEQNQGKTIESSMKEGNNLFHGLHK
jgi:hypothetical protein